MLRPKPSITALPLLCSVVLTALPPELTVSVVPGPIARLVLVAPLATTMLDGAEMVSEMAELTAELPNVSVTLMVKPVTSCVPPEISVGWKDSASSAVVTAAAVPLTV